MTYGSPNSLFGGKRSVALLAALLAAGPACDLAGARTFTGPDADDEPDAMRQAREASAKSICRTCPAVALCLDYARSVGPDEGVWAGLTADELRGLDVLAGVA